ncbi:hypothetical protein RJ641_021144 [Dillenia turbinata]|uniref:Uncharacterized protein n=1 Tax=Dillenia turbinata TaxID=194707 RepID=A0AAN8UBH4_9MAGN
MKIKTVRRILPIRGPFVACREGLCYCSRNKKQDRHIDEKVTVLESEKQAWECSPEGLAIKEAPNPWRKRDAETRKGEQTFVLGNIGNE